MNLFLWMLVQWTSIKCVPFTYQKIVFGDRYTWKWVISITFLLSYISTHLLLYIPGGPQKKRNSRYLGTFALINSYLFSPCWIEHLFLIIITPRSSKFGWELFILWVTSYGLSFSGFAIHLSLIVPRNSEIGLISKMTVHKKLLIK